MERLWAPWRREYIESGNKEGCFFCEKLKEEKDEENFILYRGEKVFLLLNIFPYNTGHLMIAPNRHQGELEGLEEEELSELFLLLKMSISAIKKAFNPEGFNVGMNLGRVAGAGIEGHLHIHIVPRWSGDTNFMPIISDTKVVSEALIETYRKIRENLV